MMSEQLRNKLDIVGIKNERQTRQTRNIIIKFRPYERIPSILNIKHSKRTLKFECNFVK